jgi:hypothetical protein
MEKGTEFRAVLFLRDRLANFPVHDLAGQPGEHFHVRVGSIRITDRQQNHYPDRLIIKGTPVHRLPEPKKHQRI